MVLTETEPSLSRAGETRRRKLNTRQHLIDFLNAEGTADVEHESKIEFLSHLKGVHDELGRWPCSEAVCLGGLFHSIYGAEGFDDAALPLDRRAEIRGLIGDEAEKLAFVNSTNEIRLV